MNVVIVGVSGGSGSGKTTFAKKLRDRIGHDRSAILLQDSYYHDQSKKFEKDGGAINFDHPDSIEFSLLSEHLKKLKRGESVKVPIYDFATHTRAKEPTVLPATPVIIVDGILILSQKEIRNKMDIKIFVETSEELRYQRRLERDVKERGRSEEGVLNQFNNHVKPMHDQFVEPSKEFASLVCSGQTDFQESTIEEVAEEILSQLSL